MKSNIKYRIIIQLSAFSTFELMYSEINRKGLQDAKEKVVNEVCKLILDGYTSGELTKNELLDILDTQCESDMATEILSKIS